MEYQSVVEGKTNDRLSELRALASAQNDPEMLWAIEEEVSLLLAVRDELRRWNHVRSKTP